MSFGVRLEMRQGQQLVMTPQLQQAIKLLQMSNMELSDYIEQELERNPLLDRGSDSDVAPAPEPPQPAAPTAAEEMRAETPALAQETFDTGLENVYADEARADAQNDAAAAREAESWAGMSRTGGGGGGSSFEDPEFSLEGRLTHDATLREHLLSQLPLVVAPPVVKLIAADLIENIDPAGYLRSDLDETAARLGTGVEEAEAALKVVQSMDPTGVGARSLAECLALQLMELNRFDPAMEALLDRLDDLAKGLTPKLAKVCGVDMEDLAQMLREIRALDPKPGSRFDHGVAQTLIPDVYVRPNAVGGWAVELNSDTLPKVLLNTRYAADVGGARGDATKTYLTECAQNANWLLKSIDQRARTILRVASEIVRQQDGFFAYGVHELRPMNLKVIAEALEIHESTVSRVTSNKYMATNRGVFEMKYFFTAAIAATDGGESYAAESIRHRIRQLIDNETAKTVLSDEKIVQILRDSGIDIARRTVAKYREAMSIPSSVQRRRRLTAALV